MGVCLALAALLGLLMVSTIRIAGTASAAAVSAATAEEVQSVHEHLRRTLGSLTPRRIDGTGPVLQSEPDSLQAAIGADRALERPINLTVALNGIPRGNGSFDVVESRTPFESLPGAASSGRPSGPTEVLLQGITGLSIRYLGALAEGARAAWHLAWLPARPRQNPGRLRPP